MIHIETLACGPAYDLIYPEFLSKLSKLDQETMFRAMHNSTVMYIGMDDDEVLAVWGLMPPTILSDRAYLWLWTTDHMVGHEFQLVRYSQRAIERALREFPILVGHCKTDAEKSIRWVRWLGGEFGAATGDYLPFEIRAKTWQPQSAQSG